MTDDREGAAAGGLSADPLAMHRAFASADTAEARDYLRRQSEVAERQKRLLDLQIADLEREDKIRHQSLRIHHIGDLLKLGFELAAALVVLAIVVVMGAAVWNAAHDDGLVIESFNVPVDMAANGLTGQVVATQIQDRLAWMQANSDTIRASNSYRNSWGDDIKVQIPNTGVSIGEFYRYLAAWLGHETHITGEIVKTDHGLTLSVREGSNAAAVFTASDLATLVSKASEEIYKRTQPYRYTVFLGDMNRIDEEIAASRAMALHGDKEDRVWAWSRLGVLLQRKGDTQSALESQRTASELNPALPHVWDNLANEEAFFGHDEAAVRDVSRALAIENAGSNSEISPVIARSLYIEDRAVRAEYSGDYRQAVARADELSDSADYSGSNESAPIMKATDLAADHDISGSLRVAPGVDQEIPSVRMTASFLAPFFLPCLPAYQRAAALGDWKAARDDLERLWKVPTQKWSGGIGPITTVYLIPLLANAEAHAGNFARAHELIDRSVLDCYLCMRVRGNVATLEKNWSAAEQRYARAAQIAPSLPFAYLEWARMRAAKGDLDGAIAKLDIANKKGPNFADPLEMWGEVLIAKNRSDLALAKFEEASKYAPHWGRLHLKWGEALRWIGNKAEAQKQFAIAGTLDLTPAEKAERVRVMHG
jgi:tetratricopeptide (TPR) repeat protein